MDLLTSSGSSVTAAAAGKAVRTWAARVDGHLDAVAEFGAPTVTIALAWVLSVSGRKGFGQEREGGRKSVHNVGVDRDGVLTLIFDVGCSTPNFSVKKYGGGMMLVCY